MAFGIKADHYRTGLEMTDQPWQCPMCHRIYGPTHPACDACNNALTVRRTLGERILPAPIGKQMDTTMGNGVTPFEMIRDHIGRFISDPQKHKICVNQLRGLLNEYNLDITEHGATSFKSAAAEGALYDVEPWDMGDPHEGDPSTK